MPIRIYGFQPRNFVRLFKHDDLILGLREAWSECVELQERDHKYNKTKQ